MMNRPGADPKVKKTLVRHCEAKIRPTTRKQVIRDVNAGCSNPTKSKSETQYKENVLLQPSLCSSEVLATYLEDVKKSLPPLPVENLNADQEQSSIKLTKNLNFHVNDRIYDNLVELNATIKDCKVKKGKRPPLLSKKDLEPNIEDFCVDVKVADSPPKISVVKPTFKPLKKVEDCKLHKLVASFEVL